MHILVRSCVPRVCASVRIRDTHSSMHGNDPALIRRCSLRRQSRPPRVASLSLSTRPLPRLHTPSLFLFIVPESPSRARASRRSHLPPTPRPFGPSGSTGHMNASMTVLTDTPEIRLYQHPLQPTRGLHISDMWPSALYSCLWCGSPEYNVRIGRMT